MLGEQFEEPNFVMGMVLKLRPMFDKIDIWLNNCENEAAIKSLKASLLEILQVNENELEFEVFAEAKQKAA